MNRRLGLVALAFLITLPLQALAQATLAPSADAYVRAGSNAAKNFGKATTLQVGTSATAGNNYDSYLKFDLSKVPAFAQAKLRLFAGLSASGTVTATLYGVPTTTWSETTITWNNKPARGAALTSATVKSKTATWIELDVTAYLLSERAQGRNVVSLALHSTANTSVYVKANSKEATSNKPQLAFTADKAPTVSLSAPTPNSVFPAPANIGLAVKVSDPDGSIAKVEYFRGTTLIGTATSTPFAFNWSNVPAGSYSLTAKATDNSGVSTTSSAVNVVVDTPPSVSVTSPADQSSFGAPASFNLSASASDSDGSIVKVEFYQGATLLQSLTQAPYTIAINQSIPGTYTYWAKATDNAGIATQSSSVTVTVKAAAPPSVSLTAPLDGARFRAPASITLTAAASDSDGTVARVDFFQDAAPIGSATQPPYSMTVNQVSAGTYVFSARAVDDTGLATQSPGVTVTVAGAPAMYYIHVDQINTPRMVTDQAARVVWRWDAADPFGASAPDEDPDGDGNRFTLNLRFPGQYFDRETGLHYNYFRDYDPGTGRYIQSDPIGLEGGLNTFAYTFSRPTSLVDPSGLWGSIPHHTIIDTKFATLGPDLLKAIKEGSDAVDSIVNQFGDTNYMHAMRGPNESVYSAKRKACKFIKEEMYLYRQYKKFPSKQHAAYYHLGKALHPIMDSTSPMHAGWPVWDPKEDWVWHGNAHGSLEGPDALTEQKLAETVKLIEDALNGKECECTE